MYRRTCKVSNLLSDTVFVMVAVHVHQSTTKDVLNQLFSCFQAGVVGCGY